MNYFENLSEDREYIVALLEQKNFACNAAARGFVAERVEVFKPRNVFFSTEVINAAEKLGGLEPGMTFDYPNAQGGTSTARACSLYDLPKDMVNPYLCCFGGMMTAPLYAMEILRVYAKQTGIVLPFLSCGKEGNKGLFKKLFYRDNGIIRKTEYDSYYKIMSYLAGPEYAYANYKECNDDNTEGNLIELYQFAKERNLQEITLVLCTGNPFYDKRLLAEWMWQLKQEKFAEVKIDLVCVHCPVFYSMTKNPAVYMPEARVSEIYNGYIAACLGPLAKDTISFDGKTTSAHPERYLMPGVAEADWEMFRELIVDYSNMGWPNYQELLYGIDHEEAVVNIILSDLFARASYTAEEYDSAILAHVCRYRNFLSGAYKPETPLLDYLVNTNDTRFFAPKRPDHIYTD